MIGSLARRPNPIWLRELKQSSRLTRTPLFLSLATVVVTLIVASVASGFGRGNAFERVGDVVFQTYFSIAFFVTAWIGPTVAANGIASEREGRTWEALRLSGLSPQSIARGKFFAALTAIGTYLVMLAPIGAVPFLFGGITATEVVLAFVILLAFAVLFVSMGLAISSRVQSLRVSIVVTLLLAIPISAFVFGCFGVICSEGIHQVWAAVPKSDPVWLPIALTRGDFGHRYATFLLLLPLVGFAVPTWFFYEVTVSNLKDETDDRSSGLKRWFVGSSVVLTITGVVLIHEGGASSAQGLGTAVTVVLAIFFGCSIFVFMDEPLTLGRRVRFRFEEKRAGWLARFLGPSLINAGIVQATVGALAMTATTAYAISLDRSSYRDHSLEISIPGGYSIAFYLFLVGFGTWLRTRRSTLVAARSIFIVSTAAIFVLPWVVAAILGAFGDASSQIWVVAAPSPAFAFMMSDTLSRANSSQLLAAGGICMGGWAIAGVLLFLSAVARKRRDEIA